MQESGIFGAGSASAGDGGEGGREGGGGGGNRGGTGSSRSSGWGLHFPLEYPEYSFKTMFNISIGLGINP